MSPGERRAISARRFFGGVIIRIFLHLPEKTIHGAHRERTDIVLHFFTRKLKAKSSNKAQ